MAENVEARLKQLGVEDLRTYFYGKTVRVAGNLKQDVNAGGIGNRLITYSLTIDSLDQLEFVEKKAAADKLPGTTNVPGPGGR